MQTMARNWWALALRGVAAIILGVLAFVMPGMTAAALVLAFGVYAFVDGIFSLIAAFRQRGTERWWVELLEGLAGIGAGVITFLYPELAGQALLYLIAAWAFVTGLMEMIAAVRLRKEIQGEALLFLAGVLSVIFAVVLVLFPAAGAMAIVWMIGGYAIAFGILLVVLAFRLRGRQATGTTTGTTTAV